jgi:pyridoxal phosphate enzyme (YggS family)
MGVLENLLQVKKTVEDAAIDCGRDPASIAIVAVSKTQSYPLMLEGIEAGLYALGENRVQEAREKWPRVQDAMASSGCEFHLVGHLQRNKARFAVRLFDLIHSVDSDRLAEELNKRARDIGKTQRVLIEVNTSGEESKFGVSPDDADPLIKFVQACPNLKLEGLMTVGPLYGGSHGARESFQTLRQLRDDLGGAGLLPQLSMGMTQDYIEAIEEGATILRIGTAIFGTRN